MKLQDLLRGIQITSVHADPETEVLGVSYDSRTTRPGDLFVAISGTAADGSQFIQQALEKGAVCAVCEQSPTVELPFVEVPSARRALALIAENYFDHPVKEMTMVGVTGTNGKTTTTMLIRHILEEKAGARVGLIGTVENCVGQQTLPAQRTTPGPWELQQLLRRMADAGCSHVVMEVSSHALAMDRVYGVRFAVGLFTNLTQDHLDYHGTMERYCAAKARLLRSCDVAVYNADDPWSETMLRGSTCRRFGYAVERESDLQAQDVQLQADHVSYTACTAWQRQPVRCGIPGSFSVYNSLAAMAVCHNLGVSLADCTEVLACTGGARGRMEVVPTPSRDYTVLIDYAHTPDALENVLTAVRGFARGRIIAVFGCGGDRDRTKRPLMGAIAQRLAHVAVVTSDNPRTENPEAIIADILAGMAKNPAPMVIENRPAAITWALDHAEAGDIIVLCGKGHETYQEVGRETYHLDEREVVAEYLRSHP